MKKFLILLFFVSGNIFGQTGKVFVSGCNWLQVALVDKQTKQIEWSYELQPGEDCENVSLTKKGDLLIAYGKGAKLINADHETIWDYPVEPRSELFSATQLPDGGFLLAYSGTPAKIVELDKKGRTRKTISFDTEVTKLHAQLRQVIKSKKGTYLIPVMGKGEVVELDKRGNEILRFKVEGNPFSVLEMKNGNLLVSCGDAHSLIEVERHSGTQIRKTSQNDIDGVKLTFVAQIAELENNNKLICNWNGHAKGKDAEQPTLIEIDKDNQLVWHLNEGNGIGKVSCVFPVQDEKSVSRFIKHKGIMVIN
jgi:hypothetical protein